MSKEWIPVHEFIKKTGMVKQTIYRWIREGKLSAKDFRVATKTVQRIEINKDYDPKKK